MKFIHKSKDGGSESNVTGYWLIEWKKCFSIVLLRFDKGSREAFHNHAFNAVSWILSGALLEEARENGFTRWKALLPSPLPIYTSRDRMHKVYGAADRTWALSFRGPWNLYWKEHFVSDEGTKEVTLTHGRKVIE
jgi:hypothetical protein